MLHLTLIYYTLTKNPCFPFSSFPFSPLFPPPSAFFGGDLGGVSMYITDVMKTLYKKLSCAIQNGYGITFSSS